MPEDPTHKFPRLAIVGAGSMGTMLALGFAEAGFAISLWDVSSDNIDHAEKVKSDPANKAFASRITTFKDSREFTASMPSTSPKVFIFSITHGPPADSVLEILGGDLRSGDIVLDGGNEYYRNTQRRQRDLAVRGVEWIGMGVSGGYQSARHGPSLSPGGSREVVEGVLPVLERFAAKARDGSPCVAWIGKGGAGHYVKMVHNGIEQGMLSTLSEAWSLLSHTLSLPQPSIANIFKSWLRTPELQGTYLIDIAITNCTKRHEADVGSNDPRRDSLVLPEVLDKVVQDADGTEGTGVWSVAEAAERHVAAPTIAAAYFLRIESAARGQRARVAGKLRTPAPRTVDLSDSERDAFVETLRRAVYASFVAGFCQGLELIARASRDEGWDVNLGTCLRIWRAGCIIQADGIAEIFAPALNSGAQIMNMKLVDEVAAALRENVGALKEVVLRGVEWDNYVPSLAASLEYVKAAGSTALPTQFMEAQLDLFGAHKYDRVGIEGEDPGKVEKGAKHFEWMPA
ncbi:6-phosphogluconate dehydrogenase, decarboxylating [Trichodelitschia bisporula]|uniref:6-phosphogluconate dehydrogenase, decarboxylating n=1 Tax=Trichodelitschia bisporula TaxID=703511 RepID=A0A6G1HN78_9PEZI|nr:6-phosphogluconate dehydrogenase, decarboxylating [Trichodelitschia bisporula]